MFEIEAMSEKLQIEKAFLDIRGHVAALNAKLIHYKITCNIDGVCVSKNSKQGEIIPILNLPHQKTWKMKLF